MGAAFASVKGKPEGNPPFQGTTLRNAQGIRFGLVLNNSPDMRPANGKQPPTSNKQVMKVRCPETNKTWCQNRVSREIDEHCHVYLVSENGPWPVNHPKTGGKSNQGMLRKTIPLSCASSSPSRQVQHFRLEDKYSIFGGLLEKLDGPGCLGHNTHLKQSLNLCLIKLTFQTNAYAPQVLAQKATAQKGDLTWSRHSPKEPSVDSALRETTNGIHPNPGALLHRSVNSTLTKSLRGWKGP